MSAPAHIPSNFPISLEQMLQRRDVRVASQHTLAARFGLPLVQLTLVNPGPVKDTAQACFIFEQGLAAISNALVHAGQSVRTFEQTFCACGPEALWAVNAAAPDIKTIAISLENQHALGRLWDIDVIGLDGRSISRQEFGTPARQCLVCDQAAHTCARSSRHALPQLQRAIKDIVDAYHYSLAA